MEKNTAETVDAKYIYLDIVKYTYNRSVEAQSELINVLNKIVKESIIKFEIKDNQLLFIPTGDGICISLLNLISPFDIHLKIALLILEKLHVYNESTNDTMRKFALRIGINENIDNLIIDINGQTNISGAGINNAVRIMNLCDENQIMVSTVIYEKLIQREEYMESFRSYPTKSKHGIPLTVYQYLNKKLQYLNNEIPSLFKPKPEPIKRLPKLIGFYIAHCIKNEEFFIKHLEEPKSIYILKVLTFYLSEDTLELSKVSKTTRRKRQKIEKPIDEAYKNLQKNDFWVICDLAFAIDKIYLYEYRQYFDDYYLFINSVGHEKLKEDHPQIYNDFEKKDL